MGTIAEMPEYRVILNPTDGSAASELATVHAVYLAKISGARLLLVYVVDEASARRAGVNIRRAMEDMRKKGEVVLSSVKAFAEANGVAAESILAKGQTAPTILNVCKDRGANLIVMGATAYSDLARLMARAVSISEEILKESRCPVLIVRGA